MPRRTLLQNGRVFDGSTGPSRIADVLIEDGVIRGIGPVGAPVADAETVDVAGRWVMPGFLDTHTHYDAEVILSPGLKESVRHGVTTVVLGSCSVTFVAAAPEDCSDLFTRVEGVPRDFVLPLLRSAKTWDSPATWRRYIDNHPLGANVASLLGHSDIRARFMGLSRSVKAGEVPTADEQKAMERCLDEALDCGFVGLSTMTNPWDKLDGDREWSKPLPSTFAHWSEYRRFFKTLRRRGRIHQSAPNLVTRYNALLMLLESTGLFRRSLKTTLITLIDIKADPWIQPLAALLSRLGNLFLRADFRWQTPPCPFDLFFDGMDSVIFEEFPAGEAVRDLARDRKRRDELISSTQYRDRFRRQMHKRLAPKVWHRDFGDARILDCPDRALVGKTFLEIARERQQDPVETFLDLIVQYDRGIRWHTCIGNHRPERLKQLVQNPDSLISFADSGAHLRNMAFYNFPLRLLKLVWDAERAGQPFMPVEKAVHRLTGELGDWFGLQAGYLREGRRADVVVLNPEQLGPEVDEITEAPFEEVGGLVRKVNRSRAVEQVYLGGERVFRDGTYIPEYGTKRYGTFLECGLT